MEINELKAFIAVTETGSFSAAARQIHLTQPAISKRIAQLENSIKQALFDRIGHQVLLTEAGERLLPYARTVLNTIEDGIHDIEQLQQLPTGTLKIATSYHIGLHHLPDILKNYYVEFPDVELDLRFMDSEDALQGIEQGEIELAIITLPLVLPEPLQGNVLWDDPMHVVCAVDHPLAKAGQISALTQHPAILPDNNTFTRKLIETELDNHGLSINVRLSSNHLESIRMMTEIGLGWSVLPDTLYSDKLTVVKFSEIAFSRKLGIITHKQRTLTQAARLFLDRLH